MIVLVVPMYSRQELNGDSNYIIYASLIREMLKTRPGWHFIVVFPDSKSGYTYTDDGLFRLPNVTRIAQCISSRKMGNAITYDARYYDKLYRRIGVDVVWCNLVEIAGHLLYAGDSPMDRKARPVIVAQHHYTIHDSLPSTFERMESVAISQIMGALLADQNIFNSEYCEQMLVETAGKYFNSESIARILAKSIKIGHGTLTDDIEPIFNDDAVPLIAYNHRLQAYKNWRETFDVFDELHQEGLSFRVVLFSASREHLSNVSRYPFVDVCLNVQHSDYIQALARCCLNVTNSQHETFCISAIESMALGQCLIAPDGITFPEITGRDLNGYPYLFTSHEQQKAHLRKLITDRAERERWGRVLSDYVRSNYTRALWATKYAALFESLTDFTLGTPDDVRETALDVLRRQERTPMTEYSLAVRRTKTGDRLAFGPQSFPLSKLARLVRELGGRVTIENGVQYVYPPL